MEFFYQGDGYLSYNNVAKGICLLDKNTFLFIQEKFMQVRAFKRYIPLKLQVLRGTSKV